MIRPRNTLVVVRLIEQATKTVGAIVVPTNNDQYCEAEILAVGPGNVAAGGGRSETFDLKAGQYVWVKAREVRQVGNQFHKMELGTVYQSGEQKYMMIEQSTIFGIIADTLADYEAIRAANQPLVASKLVN